jgi:two-component system response regulator FixJ
MMNHKTLVLVVDDDESVRDSTRALLESAGYSVKDYASAKAALADNLSDAGCVIADIRMPEMDGLKLQEELSRRSPIPMIVITGHGDVPLAVRAMKAGALDFIEKPFDDEVLLHSVRRAVELAAHTWSRDAEARAAEQLLAQLTPRERNVLEQLVAGCSNKIAAHALGISPRTIEIHRANIMDKMKARSLSDLVRITLVAASRTRPDHALGIATD